MIELMVIYALLADASSDHFPYPIPTIEYEEDTKIQEDRKEFERTEKEQDESFFRNPDPNKDRNPYYFPNSTIPRSQ